MLYGTTVTTIQSAKIIVADQTCLVMSRSFATPWTVAHQVPLSMGRGKSTEVSCHFLLQEIVLTQGLKPHTCTGGTFTTEFFTTEPTVKIVDNTKEI